MRMRSKFPITITFVGSSNPVDGDTVEPPPTVTHHQQDPAYAHHYGPYDFNAHPLAPLGTTVEHHVKPATRASFGMRSLSGWYIGVSLAQW